MLTATAVQIYAQGAGDTTIPWYWNNETTSRGIFRSDNRAEAKDKWEYKDYSRATATAIKIKYINGNKVKAVTNREALKANYGDYPMEGIRFLDQPRPGFCTGFLIAPDVIVTAGHCINDKTQLSEAAWVFDFTNDAPYNPSTKEVTINSSNVYRGVEILDSKYTGIGKEDYCFIRLDRPTGRKPYKFRTGGSISFSDMVVSIGSPSGLPLKVSDSGRVINNNISGMPQAFMNNLDLFGGNSGGPIFNKNGFIEGITVWGPKEEYYVDNTTNTLRPKIYWDFNYLLFGESEKMGNISYRLLNTNIPLLYSMVHRNLTMAMDADNTEEFDEWLTYTWIVNRKFDGLDHLLAYAIKKGKMSYAEKILNTDGLEINTTDLYGNPLVYVMASNGATDLFRKAKSKFEGLDLNVKNNWGETALMAAASNGNTEMVRALLDAGASSTIKNSDGKTASKLAKKAGYKDVAKMLKKAEKGKAY